MHDTHMLYHQLVCSLLASEYWFHSYLNSLCFYHRVHTCLEAHAPLSLPCWRSAAPSQQWEGSAHHLWKSPGLTHHWSWSAGDSFSKACESTKSCWNSTRYLGQWNNCSFYWRFKPVLLIWLFKAKFREKSTKLPLVLITKKHKVLFNNFSLEQCHALKLHLKAWKSVLRYCTAQ